MEEDESVWILILKSLIIIIVHVIIAFLIFFNQWWGVWKTLVHKGSFCSGLHFGWHRPAVIFYVWVRATSEITRTHLLVTPKVTVAARPTDDSATFWGFYLFLWRLCTFIYSIDYVELCILGKFTHLIFNDRNKSKGCQAPKKDWAPTIVEEWT